MRGRPRANEARLRALLAALPEGAVVATLPPVGSTRELGRVERVVRKEAARRGLRVADVWDASPRRGRWYGAFYQPNDVGHARWAAAVLAAARGDVADRDASGAATG